MPGFPTEDSRIPLSTALKNAQALAKTVKREAVSIRGEALTSGISWYRAINFQGDLEVYRQDLARNASVPGLAAYAQSQFDDGTIDIVTAYNNMRAEIVACRDWLEANIPVSNVGTFTGNAFVPTQYQPAALAGFVTQLDQLIATID